MNFFDDFARQHFNGFEPQFNRTTTREPVDNETYYKVLGVARDADNKTINRAYRRLAIQHHPDKGGDKEHFAKLNEARDVLTDPEKRKVYDRYGKQGIQKQGNVRTHGRRQRPQIQVKRNISITLADVFSGRVINMAIQHTILQDPQGKEIKTLDSDAMRPCDTCKGRGCIVVIRRGAGFVHQIRQPCSVCKGKGRRLKDGYVLKEVRERISVKIDPGMLDGDHIVLKSKGGWQNNQMADLVLIVRVKKHNIFERKGSDLVIDRKISLFQALMGVNFIVTMPNGEKNQLLSPPGMIVHPGMILCVPDLGVPIRDTLERGSLYCRFDVVFPDKITDTQRAALVATMVSSVTPEQLKPEKQYQLEKTNNKPGVQTGGKSSVNDDSPSDPHVVQCAQQ